MMLNLDDFGKLKDINVLKDKKSQDEKSPKEIEQFYQEKILELEKNYQETIEEIKKEFFRKGYIEASKEKELEFSKKLEEIKKSFLEEKNQDLEELEKKYRYIEKELKQKLEEYLNRLSDILLDNLDEILEFLYIKESNSEVIQNAITQTILEFKESLPLEIKVSDSLYKDVKNSFSNIKIEVDESLKDGDFIIEFYDFKLENRFKEKIEVLKDEIKRETKKFA